MKRRPLLVAILICCTVAGVSLVGASSVDGPPHLLQAEQIAAEIDASHNAYAHKNCYIHWKGDDGATYYENRSDCSDFLDLLLEHTYHFTSQQMKTWTGHARPLAVNWYETISSHKGFQIIQHVESIQPGDVIAVKFPPGASDTGHIMLAAGTPRPHLASAPLEPGTSQWELDIIDSSKSGHGVNDTRHRADGTFSQGVGKGTLRLYTGSDGTVAGYTWSILPAETFRPMNERKVVIGRLEPRN